MPRVLHLLSQRPSLTGSGITLDALMRHAAAADWDQRVVVGVPTDEPSPEVGGLEPDRIHTLRFETSEVSALSCKLRGDDECGRHHEILSSEARDASSP